MAWMNPKNVLFFFTSLKSCLNPCLLTSDMTALEQWNRHPLHSTLGKKDMNEFLKFNSKLLMKYWAERLSPLLDRHSFIIENRVSYESLFLSGIIAYRHGTNVFSSTWQEIMKTCFKRVGVNQQHQQLSPQKLQCYQQTSLEKQLQWTQ